MQTYHLYRFFVTALLFAVVFLASAQTVKQLENERKTILKQLETTNKILSETQRSQKSSINKLTVLNRSIRERQSLISTINKEITLLDSEIQKMDSEKAKLEKQLEYLRGDYAKLVQEAHLNSNNYSKLIFLLSAENFGQSFRRLRYLQEYSGYRKEQAQEIERVKTEVALKNDSLLLYKSNRLKVVREKESETRELSGDQEKEKKLYGNLQQKEKQLRAKLQEQKKQADALNKRIEKLIAEEISKAKKKSKKDDAKTKTGTQASGQKGTSVLTKEQQVIAGNFEKNRGRLPWPVEKGFISGHYGVQPHPVLKYVTINNKGIYIQTPANINARAVFDGVVTQCFFVPGSNKTVIIQHGDYRTVYDNLTTVYVKEGQKVKAKDNIGKIYSDAEDDNKTELYFQIRKDLTVLNPELWLAK